MTANLVYSGVGCFINWRPASSWQMTVVASDGQKAESPADKTELTMQRPHAATDTRVYEQGRRLRR